MTILCDFDVTLILYAGRSSRIFFLQFSMII